MKRKLHYFAFAVLLTFGLSACSPKVFSSSNSSSSASSSSLAGTSSNDSFSSSAEASSAVESSSDNTSTPESSSSLLEPKDITLDKNSLISWTEGEGVFSDGTLRCELTKAASSESGWFSLSQGGLFKNIMLSASALPSQYWCAVSVDFERISEDGYLTARGSSFEISSPENGAFEVENDVKLPLSPDGSSFPYFSLYSCVGSFVINSITLYGAEKKESEQPDFLDFYTINDTHGAADYIASKYQAGITRLSSFILNQERANPDNTMLLSSGDMWQGGALSNETYGELMVNWMNIAGFESMAIGNHEFDWTADYIARNSAIANFPFLGINILDGNNMRPSWAKPSVVIQRGQYKIGVIGAIGKLENSIAASSLGSYHFDSNFPSLVSTEATRLRTEEGCDLVVLSLHDSSFDTSLCQNIDAVFEGHTHQDYETVDSYGIPHVQCYANGSEFQKVHFEKVAGKLKFISCSCEDFSLVSAVSEEPMTKGIYDYYYAQHPEIDEVVGHTDTLISETALANISAQALCEYYKNDDWSSAMSAGILNWGGVRQTIPAGDITFAEVYAALPFDNDNVLCSLTGDNFKKIFSYSSSLAIYSSVATADIDSSKTYYAMIISYVSDYDYYSPLLTQIKRDTTTRLRDIVADYFKEGENV